ncbi:MAG: transferrin receptor-like dimerization domain-containing protein [Phycisphaerales bacterium]
MRTTLALACLALVTSLAPAQDTPIDPAHWCFTADRQDAQLASEQALTSLIDADRLRAWHDMACARPHPAGSVGDRALIRALATELTRMGLDVEVQWFEALLAHPVDASLELIASGDITQLPIKEPPVEGDACSASDELTFGFNAYSATGEVTAPYVYANYGRWQDFERLEELGVEVEGKIVIARYGGNYRGFKAQFAQEAGAVGLVMFTDPANSARGPVYPEGGWANEHAIQRGSILTGPYPGDPLTPGVFAGDEDAERLSIDDIELPAIPVQPVGYEAIEPVLRAMSGPDAPEDWQGGIDTAYRLTSGGAALTLRVEQDIRPTRTANVIATLRGDVQPELEVIAGCHHDAWTHGAGDPGAGTMVLLELARVFAERARAGDVPDRTLRFCFWGAEEHGIIGSTEYVESREFELKHGCIAYINLDMAAMGPRFGASAAPSLGRVIREAAGSVASIADPSKSLLDEWAGPDGLDPRVGTMGGGSDHVAFQCRAGVPCMALSMRGAQGVSYHSAYDTLAWYRKVVGEDYQPAVAVSKVAALILSRLANADVLPLEPWTYGDACARAHIHLEDDLQALNPSACTQLHTAWHTWRQTAMAYTGAMLEALDGQRDPYAVNAALMRADRAWIETEGKGLPGRDWYRNHFAAPDERSGYSAWVLPGLRAAIERRDPSMLRTMSDAVLRASRRAEASAMSLDIPAPTAAP